MNESANPILKYFSEFKILKTVSKDFWLTNVVQFFDGMAYFSMITVFVLYLTAEGASQAGPPPAREAGRGPYCAGHPPGPYRGY